MLREQKFENLEILKNRFTGALQSIRKVTVTIRIVNEL